MGNEFGHPEWIDFPREGNNWSYRYARRQWRLMDDPLLKYRFLANFDRDMIALTKKYNLLAHKDPRIIFEHSNDKVIIFKRADLLFVFNFHSTCSYTDYSFEVPAGRYRMIFNSDAPEYGGHGRLVSNQHHFTLHDAPAQKKCNPLSLYLPTRTAFVLQSVL